MDTASPLPLAPSGKPMQSLSRFQIHNRVIVNFRYHVHYILRSHLPFDCKFVFFMTTLPDYSTSLPFLTNTDLISLSMSVFFVCFVFFLDSTCEIMQYLSFSFWVISLRIMSSKSIYIFINDTIFFFLRPNNTCARYKTFPFIFFYLSSINDHVSLFQVLAIVLINEAAVSTGVQIPCLTTWEKWLHTDSGCVPLGDHSS